MPRFILISDIHATDQIPIGRLDNVVETFDYKFSFVLGYAKRHRCIILQAGDLFNKSRSWTMLDYFMRRLGEYSIPLYAVFGQHDQYNRANPMNTPTAMLTLMRSGLVRPLTAEPTMIGDVAIFGANWKDKIPRGNRSTKNILVLHAPITMKEEWPGQDFTHPRYFLKRNYYYDLVLVGDIHRAFITQYKGQHIVNTGPMLRLEANKYNFEHKPHFYVWDSRDLSIKKIEIPHKKADEVLTREHLEIKKLSKQELDSFANSLKNMKPLSDMRKQRIKEHLKSYVKNRLVKQIIEEIIDDRY